ncbi:hypothetical protein CEXT_651781 [Caerostris extrusa]|uniref:Uncharacterized protein n=1 Tax=Caerostris extrusa TaxID=172846 RepID=A0AAV4X6G1_CAEEX|nr:hypothetical protein CEXT_651781 [Caerostris extrusa]
MTLKKSTEQEQQKKNPPRMYKKINRALSLHIGQFTATTRSAQYSRRRQAKIGGYIWTKSTYRGMLAGYANGSEVVMLSRRLLAEQ